MPVGKPLHLRLFLEGWEVPVISASVNIGVNAPSACSIQLVPLDELMDLKPRTLVHVFYLDSRAARKADGSLAGGLSESYKLLFSGETIGFSTVLTPTSRAIVLQCVDFSSYWDSAHASAIAYGPGGNAFTAQGSGSMSGGGNGLFDDIVDQQQNVVLDWIRSKPKTPGLEKVSGLAGGIIRMMEAMGGVIPHHRGINDFFTVAELRCRFLHQITAEEGDNTAARVMGAKVFDQWLKNGLQNIGNQVTFRDMMLMLMKYIYYDFVPCPAPKFEDGFVGSEKVTFQAEVALGAKADGAVYLIQTCLNLVSDAATNRVDGQATQIVAVQVVGLLDKTTQLLKNLSTDDPRFAAVFSKVSKILLGVRSTIYALKIDSEARALLLEPTIPKLQEAIAELTGVLVKETRSAVKKKTQAQRLHTMIVRPDCWFAPPPVCNVIFPEQFSQVSYDRNYMGETTRLYVGIFSQLIGKDPTLDKTTIIAPNNGFDLTALLKETGVGQYQLLLDHEIHTGIIPKSEWVSDTMAGGGKASAADAVTTKGKRLDWANRIALFHFFKYRFATRQLSVAGKFNPNVVCGFPGAVIRRPYIIPGGESSLQELMKKSPTLATSTSSGATNSVLDFINVNSKELGAPTQFIGMIVNVQHTVSQDGGTTMVQMSHARSHTGTDDDFIQIFLKQNKGKSKRLVKTTYAYEQVKSDPVLLKFLASVTPQVTVSAAASKVSQKTIEKVFIEQTKASKRPDEASSTTSSVSFARVSESAASAGSKPTLVVSGSIEKANLSSVLVPAPEGKTKVGDKGRFGEIVGIQVNEGGDYQDGAAIKSTVQTALTLDTDERLLRIRHGDKLTKSASVFSSVRVFRSVTVYEEVSVEVEGRIPIEQVMRPPWFSPKYDNTSIGKEIYQPFFGCDSVIDTMNVTGVQTSFPASVDASGTSFSSDKKPGEVLEELKNQESEKVSISIEKAINTIGYLYGQVKQQGLDVDEFISQLTSRPVATLADIFGDNLNFLVSNNVATPIKVSEDRDLKIGFHSGAVHPALVDAGSLVGLLEDPLTGLNQVGKTGKKEVIPPRYDVRQSKRERVLAYLSAFNTSRAFRG